MRAWASSDCGARWFEIDRFDEGFHALALIRFGETHYGAT